MLGPQSDACFPFPMLDANCCEGKPAGATCSSSSECLGMQTCREGICHGESNCTAACIKDIFGAKRDCCVPELFQANTCTDDRECQGARYCSADGFCEGISGCQEMKSGITVSYDIECVCSHIGEFCSYASGIPCADGCHMWQPSEGRFVCSRLAFATVSDKPSKNA